MNIKEIPTQELAIYSNQISSYGQQLAMLIQSIEQTKLQLSEKNVIFDYDTRINQARIKIQEARTIQKMIMEEIDRRVKKTFDLTLDFSFIEDVMLKIENLQKNNL